MSKKIALILSLFVMSLSAQAAVQIGGVWYASTPTSVPGPVDLAPTIVQTGSETVSSSFVSIDAGGNHAIESTITTTREKQVIGYRNVHGANRCSNQNAQDIHADCRANFETPLTLFGGANATKTLTTADLLDRDGPYFAGLRRSATEPVVATDSTAFIGEVPTRKIFETVTGANAEGITGNRANIATNRANIATNRRDIDTNTQSIVELRAEDEKLRSGIAAAIALSSQVHIPSGKKSAIGVSGGSFDGENALAVQFVHRNNDVTWDFGGASSGGETAYRLGVSLAW